MAHVTHAAFDAPIAADLAEPRAVGAVASLKSGAAIALSLHHDLSEIEQDWRAFQAEADCTAFQTFDWLSTWHKHIGVREGVMPAIVIARQDGKIILMLPLALEPGSLRRVRWFGAYLCNCSAPLLARDFSRLVPPARFLSLWNEIGKLLRSRLRHNMIDLDKMPDRVGAQSNPMLTLDVSRHPSDAYLMHLPEKNWDEFCAAKRSSSRRRTDNKKRRRLSDFGEIRFSIAVEPADIERTIDALIEEKRSSYANLGVANMFEWPGYRDFFQAMAGNPRCREFAHVSAITVAGNIVAANFGLAFKGNYDYVLAGYDNGPTASCSTGALHLQELMRYCTERGIRTFDFNIGDEPYKHEWFDTEVKLFDHVAPASLRGVLAVAVVRAVRSAKGFIKRHPAIWPMIRRARSLAGILHRR